MKKKEILVFGASGFIGTNIIRKLTKNNHKVTAVTRNVHQKGIRIKTQGNFGYLNVIEANIFDIDKLHNYHRFFGNHRIDELSIRTYFCSVN